MIYLRNSGRFDEATGYIVRCQSSCARSLFSLQSIWSPSYVSSAFSAADNPFPHVRDHPKSGIGTVILRRPEGEMDMSIRPVSEIGERLRRVKNIHLGKHKTLPVALSKEQELIWTDYNLHLSRPNSCHWK